MAGLIGFNLLNSSIDEFFPDSPSRERRRHANYEDHLNFHDEELNNAVLGAKSSSIAKSHIQYSSSNVTLSHKKPIMKRSHASSQINDKAKGQCSRCHRILSLSTIVKYNGKCFWCFQPKSNCSICKDIHLITTLEKYHGLCLKCFRKDEENKKLITSQSSQPPQTSQISQPPQTSQISQISQSSQLSQLSQLPQISQSSQLSQLPQISQSSQLSQLPQISQSSQLSQSSQTSQNSQPPQTSSHEFQQNSKWTKIKCLCFSLFRKNKPYRYAEGGSKIIEFSRVNHHECSICLEHFNDNEEIEMLPCLHYFHHSCMNTYRKNKTHLSCPMCRQRL